MKPYVKGNKNDANDAEAICEAVGRPNMRFVPIKTVEQQNIQALHRVRTELVRQRTAKVNQIRGLLGEYGIIVRQGVAVLRKALPDILEDAENGLMSDFRALLAGLREDLVYLDERVQVQDQLMQTLANSHESARHLLKLRGVGPITATALVASLGDGHLFQRGREASTVGNLGYRLCQQNAERRITGRRNGCAQKRSVMGRRHLFLRSQRLCQ